MWVMVMIQNFSQLSSQNAILQGTQWQESWKNVSQSNQKLEGFQMTELVKEQCRTLLCFVLKGNSLQCWWVLEDTSLQRSFIMSFIFKFKPCPIQNDVILSLQHPFQRVLHNVSLCETSKQRQNKQSQTSKPKNAMTNWINQMYLKPNAIHRTCTTKCFQIPNKSNFFKYCFNNFWRQILDDLFLLIKIKVKIFLFR
jgi:hypothetical protein